MQGSDIQCAASPVGQFALRSPAASSRPSSRGIPGTSVLLLWAVREVPLYSLNVVVHKLRLCHQLAHVSSMFLLLVMITRSMKCAVVKSIFVA
eukprot:4457892-Amphidinium_carterae.1